MSRNEKVKVLCLEDDITARSTIENILKNCDYEVRVGNDGEEGIEIIENGFIPSLIITDINMPKLNGLKFIEKLKEKSHLKIPVIIITAYTEAEYLFEAIKLQVNSFVTKPIDIQLLLNRINEIVKKLNFEKEMLELENKRLLAEQEVIENLKKIEIANMFDGIIHQWRQPLSYLSVLISGQIVYQETGVNNEVEKLIEDLKKMDETIVYMNETISDFREYLKPENQDIEKEFLFSEVLNKVEHLIAHRISKIGLKINKDEGLDNLVIKGNSNYLVQVILNIFNNSIDACIQNEIKKPTIEINTNKTDNLQLDIIDNAGGIPLDAIDKIFEYRFTTKGSEGTGIGLNLCKNIIEEKFNGSMSMENIRDGVLTRLVLKA